MYCPNCRDKAIRIRRLMEAGYDPLMEEWECSNERCKTIFYVTKPTYNPPVLARTRAIKADQSELSLV